MGNKNLSSVSEIAISNSANETLFFSVDDNETKSLCVSSAIKISNGYKLICKFKNFV